MSKNGPYWLYKMTDLDLVFVAKDSDLARIIEEEEGIIFPIDETACYLTTTFARSGNWTMGSHEYFDDILTHMNRSSVGFWDDPVYESVVDRLNEVYSPERHLPFEVGRCIS